MVGTMNEPNQLFAYYLYGALIFAPFLAIVVVIHLDPEELQEKRSEYAAVCTLLSIGWPLTLCIVIMMGLIRWGAILKQWWLDRRG